LQLGAWYIHPQQEERGQALQERRLIAAGEIAPADLPKKMPSIEGFFSSVRWCCFPIDPNISAPTALGGPRSYLPAMGPLLSLTRSFCKSGGALPDIRLQGPLGYSSNQMNVWKREFDDHQISPE
jgi:hypothetical protein